MKSNIIKTFLIYVLVAVIYNIFIFFLFEDFNHIFWISYGFMSVIYLLHMAAILLFTKEKKLQKKFMGLPLIFIFAIGVGFEFAASLIFMLLRNIVSIKLTIFVQSFILVVMLVFVLGICIMNTSFTNNSKKIKSNIVFIKGICIDLESLIDGCKGADIKNNLKKLLEVVRYSDPMSNEMVTHEENVILEKVIQLKVAAENDNASLMQELIGEIRSLFEIRNKKLLATK